MRPMSSGPQQLTPEGSGRDLASSTRTPHLDREALRAPAHSMQAANISYYPLLATNMHKN
jgi:hypothetical protein